MRIKLKKGLDIPLQGRPQQLIGDAPEVSSVAVLGTDFAGFAPRIAVQEGQRVRLGQTLVTDKRNPEICFTAPGSGEVTAIHRGARRALQSIVVRLDGDDEETFDVIHPERMAEARVETIRANLLASGLWTAFRTRPFSRVPPPETEPAAVFVTAIDTNPLAPDPSVIIAEATEAFDFGLRIIARLTGGYLYICTAPRASIACPGGEQLQHVEFSGPHPAGLAGTHIHFLHPVGEKARVWHIGYQDVIAIGRLFETGRLPVQRVVSVAGPCVIEPCLLRTRLGARIYDLLRGKIRPGKVRLISGSVLSGHRATGPLAWLGRYHNQVTVLEEGTEREFLSFMKPGTHKYSSLRAYASHLLHRGDYALTTSQNGSPRAMVPIGAFERVVPLDVLPTPLLKALVVRDIDRARELGCLELDEEDLALCSFVCNGKYEYGPYLRDVLDELERNG